MLYISSVVFAINTIIKALFLKETLIIASNDAEMMINEQNKKKHRYVTFKIDDGKIRVDKVGPREADYDAFLGDLVTKDGEADDCRYAIYDFEFTVQTQGTEALNRSKLILISWCPDTAKIKKKMLYSSSFDALKKSLVGVHKYVQATDSSEASEEQIMEKLRSTDRS